MKGKRSGVRHCDTKARDVRFYPAAKFMGTA
jgi:hypothetical protein